MRVSCGLLAGVSVAVLFACTAGAQPAINYDGSLDHARFDRFTIGSLFTVGPQSLSVTALGAQDFGSGGANTDGFAGGSVPIGIWNAAGTTLLTSATVVSADPLTGTYRYNTGLSNPLVLVAGTQYLIGAVVGSNGGSTTEYWGDSEDPARPGIPDSYSVGSGLASLDEPRVAFAATLTAPTTHGGGAGGRWAPANFQATVVPEPASIGLIGILGAASLTRRRRETAKS